MFSQRTSVGLDVHARSVRAAVIDTVTGEVIERAVAPQPAAVVAFVAAVAGEHGPVLVTYEAGPTGFGLARALKAAGFACQVAAPSKLLRPSGDRVKTDRRDALLLARLARNDDIVAVTVPSVAQESARDLVRAREDARMTLMSPPGTTNPSIGPGRRCETGGRQPPPLPRPAVTPATVVYTDDGT